jgi:hypothetical protein
MTAIKSARNPARAPAGDGCYFATASHPSDDLLATLSGPSASNVLNPLQAFYRRTIDREELANEPTKGGGPSPREVEAAAPDRRPWRSGAVDRATAP